MKLGVLSVDPNDGTSYYRSWGPLSQLPEIQLKELTIQSSWKDVMQVDGVFMQRPFGADAVQFAHKVKKQCKFLWCDWDDNVFEVPQLNPGADYFKAHAPSVIDLSLMADAVSLSTNTLTEVFSAAIKRRDHIHLIPNAVDYTWYDKLKPLPRPDTQYKMSILWRGSASQSDEIRYFAPQIEYLILKHPEVLWIFQGYKPYFLLQNLPENAFRYIPWSDIPECFVRQYQVQPDIMAITLSDTRFNRCRSHGAWLEGTMAGAVCVAPAWEEWDHKSIMNYETPNQFVDRIEALISMSAEQRKELHTCAINEIKSEYTWDVTNKQRMRVLEQLGQTPSQVAVQLLPR